MLMQTYEARLDGLRKELARRGLDGFVIPISDEHMSEYVGSYAQRLKWLTGFGGSAGSAAVLAHKAAMFTDGGASSSRSRNAAFSFSLQPERRVCASWRASFARSLSFLPSASSPWSNHNAAAS